MLFISPFYLLFLFLIYFNFCPDFFDHAGKRLDKSTTVNFKFMTSQTGKQITTTHILSNISRSKDTQTVKFGQLIEYNVRNIFLQKLC